MPWRNTLTTRMVLQSGTCGFYETNSMSQRGVGFKKKTAFLRELFFIVSDSLYIFPEPAGQSGLR